MSGIENSKLCQLLETFSAKEMSAFSDFVASPFYNKNKILILLVQELTKIHPNYEKVKKEKLEVKIKSTAGLVKDMSALLKLSDKFMIISHIEQRPNLDDFIRIAELNKRGAGKALQSSAKGFKSRMEETKIKSLDELLYDYLVNEELDSAYTKDVTLPYSKSLQDKSDSLDVFYVYNKLKVYTEMQIRERVLNDDFEKTFYKEIKAFIDRHPEVFKHYPSIQIYLNLVELGQAITREKYHEFVSSLKESVGLTSQAEAANFVQHAINHCIQKMNTGSDYLAELFEIMQFQVEENLLVVDGFVHDRSYKNIVEVAIRMKEYEWAHQFMDSHIEYVPTEDRSMIYNYNVANLHAAKGEYKAALRNLTFLNFKNVFYQVSCKLLLIKIYFETNDTISVESSVNNFKSYLKREKSLSVLQKDMYNNFLKNVLALTRIQDKEKQYQKEELIAKAIKLKESMNEEKHLADKRWLLAQLEKWT